MQARGYKKKKVGSNRSFSWRYIDILASDRLKSFMVFIQYGDDGQ